ncbi:Glycosyltransferase [Quillaja saponaria]|uniref:Glycosyltransferase n=1 Tax=Quillaja saponaria TaxID=32244 RepID=A0AAD7L729_QUISA|nr:Glycosyltransferase [Quillaja saponaria]
MVNPFVPWFIDVAENHGIPCALLWIHACSLYSIYHRYFKNNTFPNFENPNETIELPGLPLFEVKDLPDLLLPSSPPSFYQLASDFGKRLDKVKWVLGTSFYELKEEIVKSMDSLIPIRPSVSPFLLGEEKENNSVSVDMWNADEGSDKEIGELSSEFLEEIKGRYLVVTWCPQEKVFDQWTNAFLLAQVFKIGVRMRFKEDGVVSAEEVERCIMEVMEGSNAKEMKNKALNSKEAANKAFEIGDSSDMNINIFISEIIGKSFKASV